MDGFAAIRNGSVKKSYLGEPFHFVFLFPLCLLGQEDKGYFNVLTVILKDSVSFLQLVFSSPCLKVAFDFSLVSFWEIKNSKRVSIRM